MCIECIQTPCHPRCPNAEPDPYMPLPCSVSGCRNEIHLGEEYFDDYGDVIICRDCLEEISAARLLNMLGKDLEILSR
jgi:hypothetical protein